MEYYHPKAALYPNFLQTAFCDSVISYPRFLYMLWSLYYVFICRLLQGPWHGGEAYRVITAHLAVPGFLCHQKAKAHKLVRLSVENTWIFLYSEGLCNGQKGTVVSKMRTKKYTVDNL